MSGVSLTTLLLWLPCFRPQTVANVLWALAELDARQHCDYAGELLRWAAHSLQRFTPQVCSSSLCTALPALPILPCFAGTIENPLCGSVYCIEAQEKAVCSCTVRRATTLPCVRPAVGDV